MPSNTIGEQVYCIIGARESYLKALKIGHWDGFECSLTTTTAKNIIVSKLNETHETIMGFLRDRIDESNLNLLFDLLEHEVQHHGQWIRYAYANKLSFPESWKKRYNV